MLRNKIALMTGFVALVAASSCKKPNTDSSTLDSGDRDDDIVSTFLTATKSPLVFDMYYGPMWLVEERAVVNLKGEEKGFRACTVTGGIQNQEPTNQFETILIPETCKLDPLKVAQLSVVFMNNKNSSVDPQPIDGRMGKAFRLPITSEKNAPCKFSGGEPWTKVASWQDIPGLDILGEDTKKEFDNLQIESVYLNKQTAVALINTTAGSHLLPSPKICSAGANLNEVKTDAADWAKTWKEVVHSETSYYNDVHFYDTKLMSEPYSYWYRNYVKHFLDTKSGGNALVFAKDEDAKKATLRIQNQITDYVQNSSMAKVTMIPTLHLTADGSVSCMSMQFVTEQSHGEELKFKQYRDWNVTPEKDAFTALTFYSFVESESRQLSNKIFQVRYTMGRYRLTDRADEAAVLLPVNGTESGYPLCYRSDGECLLQVGANIASQKTCEAFIQDMWAN